MHHTKMYNYPRLPALMNYEAAKQHFEAVKPIRGRYPEEKPLGAVRRYTDMTIRKEVTAIPVPNDPLGEFATIYSCQLYSGKHNRIDYYPNGEIKINAATWRGPTTMMFLTYTLKRIGEMRSASGKWYFINHSQEAFLLGNEGLTLNFVDGHGYRPLEIKPEYKYRVKRKEMNRLRKTYKPFIEYTRNMLLMDSKVDKQNLDKTGDGALQFLSYRLVPQYSWSHEEAGKNRTKFFNYVKQAQDSNDLDLMYKLARYVSSCFGWYNYSQQNSMCSPTAFENGFTEVLKYEYAKEVFESIERPIGEGFFDRNYKYM